jgi:UDP-glucose 4-epimerase
MAKVLKGESMPIFGDGKQTRSFSYISTVARCIAESGSMPEAADKIVNIGGDQSLSVHDLALEIGNVMGVEAKIQWLPARQEVMHAHCRHDLARTLFKSAYSEEVSIQKGLRLMADFVRANPVPPPTECPAPIEIADHLPPSWAARLVQTR